MKWILANPEDARFIEVEDAMMDSWAWDSWHISDPRPIHASTLAFADAWDAVLIEAIELWLPGFWKPSICES